MNIKTGFVLILLSFFALQLKAQDDVAQRLKDELDNKDYEKIIKEDAPRAREYTALAVYNIGMAYFLVNDDNNCIKFMNLAIEKDPNLADAYYTKGMSLSFLEEYEKAIQVLNTAIGIDPNNAQYYTAIGDVYFKTEVYEEALNAYKKAVKQKDPTERAYTMIPQALASLKKMDKALEAFYDAKAKVSKGSESYKVILFNIGLLENLNGNYAKAEPPLKELLILSPENYRAYAKLIQVYYGKKEYEKATPLRDTLYKAYKVGKLKATLKTMYCFDQFKWKDKRIEAYEKFAEPVKSGDTKYIFYVMSGADNIDFKIQAEYEPILKEQGSAKKYILCKEQSELHATYSLFFEENPNYDELKKGVLDILEAKITPTATTQEK